MNVRQKSGHAPVSVVIPCYCCSETIETALASVAAQTLRPQEVILIEDASPDGGKTLARLRDLAEQYRNDFTLKLIALDRNGGAGSARNRGWEAASQPYLAFLDADDAWRPKKIEMQYGYMRSNADVVLCGHAFEFYGATQEYPEIHSISAKTIRPLQILLSNAFVTPSAMVRLNVPLRFQAGKRYMEDHLLWMEMVLAGFRVVRLSAPLALLRKAQFGENGLSANLWAMEKGELQNYWFLQKSGRLSLPAAWGLMGYSLAKYVRRLIIVMFRRLRSRAGKAGWLMLR